METIEVSVSGGMRGRLERIKNIRRNTSGIVLSDQDIVAIAVANYWLECEKKAG